MGWLHPHVDGEVLARPGETRPCVVVRLDGYPYDCRAADLHPDHHVFLCETHRCWWHTAPEPMETAAHG